MTLTENPFLTGNYGPVSAGDTRRPTSRSTARSPRELRGPLPAHRAQPVRRCRPARTTGSSATAWCTASSSATASARWYRNRWVRTDDIAHAMGEQPVAGPTPPMYDTSNTHVIGHAGRILALTEGAMPYELSPDARHAAPHRLRRTAADRLHRAPEDRSGHRRAARVRVLVRRAVSHVPRDRRDREARAQRADHAPALGDDPRLRGDPRERALLRPAGGVRPRDAAVPVPLGRRSPGRVGVMPRIGWRRRRALVRRRSLLRVPSDERVRRRRHGRGRRAPPPDDVQAQQASARTTAASADARAVDDRPRRRARSARSASTSGARSSRASTRRCSAHGTASATRSGVPNTRDAFDGASYLKHDFVAGTSEEHDFGERPRARRVRVRAERGRDERGRRLADGLRVRRGHRPLRPRDPRRPRLHAPRPSRPCTCPCASPSASTAAGSPTRLTRTA